MANTYSQIYMQFVFAVKHRESVIHKSWKDELYKYITGIVQNHGHKMIAINGMPDHIHILVGKKPGQSEAELLREIKGSSSKWINERRFLPGRFEWQEGYGAFTYSRSKIHNVANYIENQEAHHKTITFRTEYITLLKEFEVEYNEKYIFLEVA
jgi:REP element-mobilizing transposase RayT